MTTDMRARLASWRTANDALLVFDEIPVRVGRPRHYVAYHLADPEVLTRLMVAANHCAVRDFRSRKLLRTKGGDSDGPGITIHFRRRTAGVAACSRIS